MKVLITGGTGALGQMLVRKVIQDGHQRPSSLYGSPQWIYSSRVVDPLQWQ